MCGGGRRQSPTACHAVASLVYMLRVWFVYRLRAQLFRGSAGSAHPGKAPRLPTV